MASSKANTPTIHSCRVRNLKPKTNCTDIILTNLFFKPVEPPIARHILLCHEISEEFPLLCVVRLLKEVQTSRVLDIFGKLF